MSIRNNFICFIAFALPLSKQLVPPLIILTLILWLFEGKLKEKIQAAKATYILPAISFYLLHLLGMVYTSDLKAGGFDLEQKLTLVMLPLLFLTKQDFNKVLFHQILKSFVFGSVLAGIICVTNALVKYYFSNEIDSFFYSQFSAIMHASYFAMYLNFAIIILLFTEGVLKNTVVKIVILLFLIALIVLISSKSGVLSLVLILLSKFTNDIFIKKRYIKAVAMFFVLVTSTFAVYFLFPKSFERLSEMNHAINSSTTELNTTTTRIAIWKHAAKIISKHYLLGVGTGDVKDALKAEYNKQSETQLIENQLNAHNQYLQTCIALGLPGILVLLSSLIAIGYLTVTNNLVDGALLTLIIAFNLLFESMLETQSGVVFISFFLTLYFKLAITDLKSKNSIIAK